MTEITIFSTFQLNVDESAKTDTQGNKQKQIQIQSFVITTNSDQSLAKTYLSRHNWDIDAAVESFFNVPNRHTQQYSNDTDMVS